MIKIYYRLFLSLIFFAQSFEKHFRGGTISWKQIFSNETLAIVNVKISLSFALIDANNKTFFYCNKSIIDNQNLLGTSDLRMLGQIHVGNSVGRILLQNFSGIYCNDFSVSENWMIGGKSKLFYNFCAKLIIINYFKYCFFCFSFTNNLLLPKSTSTTSFQYNL